MTHPLILMVDVTISAKSLLGYLLVAILARNNQHGVPLGILRIDRHATVQQIVHLPRRAGSIRLHKQACTTVSQTQHTWERAENLTSQSLRYAQQRSKIGIHEAAGIFETGMCTTTLRTEAWLTLGYHPFDTRSQYAHTKALSGMPAKKGTHTNFQHSCSTLLGNIQYYLHQSEKKRKEETVRTSPLPDQGLTRQELIFPCILMRF